MQEAQMHVRNDAASRATVSELAVMTTPVTCTQDGIAHEITDEVMAAAMADQTPFEAVCGHIVLPAPLVAPNGRPCRRCAMFLSAQRTLPNRLEDDARHRRSGWLGRLLHPSRGKHSSIPRHTTRHRTPRFSTESNAEG
jgi:hypothetical protein